MFLIYCDETNLAKRKDDFLIYGGLMIDSANLDALSKEMWELRRRYNIDDTAELKYLPAPDEITGNYNDFKKECIELCIRNECKLLTYQILHDIATHPDEARRNGINEICMNFHYELKNQNEIGIIFVDRFNDRGNQIDAHLRRKFSVGLEGDSLLTNPYPLPRVVGLHYTTIGQSHMTSLIDIVLGTYRTALNIVSRQQSDSEHIAKEILEFISPLFRRASDDCITRIAISFSPKTVWADRYRRKYVDTISFMNSCGYNLTQTFEDPQINF